MKVFFSLAILLVCMQAALGFMPTAPLRTRQAIKMSATNNKMTEVIKTSKSALAGLTPLILASPVFATEGTGEVLGVDDPRILPIIASIGAAFAFLFSSWSNKQDNEEFFNGYQDSERKVCSGWTKGGREEGGGHEKTRRIAVCNGTSRTCIV
eukprot:evm.model.NODE_31064_length_22544_cov_18.799192.3